LIFKQSDTYLSNIRCPKCNEGHFRVEGIDDAINREADLIEVAIRIQGEIWGVYIPSQMKGFSIKKYLNGHSVNVGNKILTEAVILYKFMILNFAKILNSNEYEIADVNQDLPLPRLSLELARLTAIYQKKFHRGCSKLILGPLDKICINGANPKVRYSIAEHLRAANTEETVVEQLRQQIKALQQHLQHIELMLHEKNNHIAELQQTISRLIDDHSIHRNIYDNALEMLRAELLLKDKTISDSLLKERYLLERLRNYESRVDHVTTLLESIDGNISSIHHAE